MKRVKNIILTFVLAIGSVSCVSKLAYTEPELPLPEKFQYTATADTASIANLEWKQFFSDPILQGLIEKGIFNVELEFEVTIKNPVKKPEIPSNIIYDYIISVQKVLQKSSIFFRRILNFLSRHR